MANLADNGVDYTTTSSVLMSTQAGALALGQGRLGFYHGLFASISVVVVSEIGDKTWFIAAIMAMRHSRLAVFSGAMAALALMTVLSGIILINIFFFSATLGWVTQIIPYQIVFYISTALFAFFGFKMLYEGYHMPANSGQEEFEEAQADVQKSELDMESSRLIDLESAFTLTFVAEWGDRSQLTTIVLGARENVIGVILGGVLGHAICTGIAVVGGRLLAQRISVRTVTLIGGVVFLIFAFSAVILEYMHPTWSGPNDALPAVTTTLSSE